MANKITKYIDILLKISDLLSIETNSKNVESKEDLCDANLFELRDLYSSLNKSYDRLRTKAITMLAGEVAIVGFLFSGKKGVPFPEILYGTVFYGVGILLLTLPFVIFLWIISPDSWRHPVDLDSVSDLKKKFESKNHYSEHMVGEYILAIQANANKLDKRAKPFVWAMYMLSSAIFILLMLKYGGGKV